MVFVIDLRRFQVSQTLEHESDVSDFWFYKWSKQDRMLNIEVFTTFPSVYQDKHY